MALSSHDGKCFITAFLPSAECLCCALPCRSFILIAYRIDKQGKCRGVLLACRIIKVVAGKRCALLFQYPRQGTGFKFLANRIFRYVSQAETVACGINALAQTVEC